MEEVLRTQLRTAIVMLGNYAANDERNGDVEDAEFTRQAINKMLDAVCSCAHAEMDGDAAS